jgi:hypothetical protein
VLTAYGSVLLALLVTALPTARTGEWLFRHPQQLADLGRLGGHAPDHAYLMGTVCEKKNTQVRELRQTYNGVLVLLRHFISKDEYTEHHSYRVSEYAARIGARLNLNDAQIEDIKAAGLLHDIGKLDISRDLLYKAAQFTAEEYTEMQRHVERGVATLETVGGSLRRVIPIVLAHTTASTAAVHTTRATRSRSRRASSRWPTSTTRSRATALPQGDVAVRRQGHHREGRRHRLRPTVVEAFLSRIPQRRAGSPAAVDRGGIEPGTALGAGRLRSAYAHAGGVRAARRRPLAVRRDGLSSGRRRHARQLPALGADVPPVPPRALLVVSAHWEAPVPTVMTSAHPPMLYDYYGFPPESYTITWPAPGRRSCASRVRALLGEAASQRGGRDARLRPRHVRAAQAHLSRRRRADVQLSLKEGSTREHIAIGRALAPLRDEASSSWPAA